MRKKTLEKRDQILEVATKHFLKKGFDGVTMDMIACDVGGSKATLYNYFKKKDDLFVEVVLTLAQKLKGPLVEWEEANTDFGDFLVEFGVNHLKFITSTKMISIRRLVATQGQTSIGQTVYERGFKQCWGDFQDTLEAGIRKGILKDEQSSWVMAMHFKGLIEADFIERSLLCSKFSITTVELSRTVRLGVEAFLSLYGNSLK